MLKPGEHGTITQIGAIGPLKRRLMDMGVLVGEKVKVGNPNSGKSTLINAIAGTRLHVGNWPGVTVEKKTAIFGHEGRRITLVDLPGTYSLSPYTQEEIVARDYLVHERPDVIINVVDATNLERICTLRCSSWNSASRSSSR